MNLREALAGGARWAGTARQGIRVPEWGRQRGRGDGWREEAVATATVPRRWA